MIQIIWPMVWVGTIVFFISYFRMRDRIPTRKRDLFEKWIMSGVIILLLINIFFIINERKETANEINDCIRFYRYFPLFQNDSDFYFIQKCKIYFTPDELQRLKVSGFNYQKRLLEGGI